MTIAVNSLTVDCHDPKAVARFWSAAEVAPLEALGARRAEIGQGEVSWVVMEDVEGNHFCVLKSLPKEGDAS